jgi:hypothetical protein
MPIAAPGQQRPADLHVEAQRCAKAMLGFDVSAALACMHPRLVEALGGSDRAAASLERQRKAFADQGASFESVSIGTSLPGVVLHGREFVFVPQTQRIRVRDGVLRQRAYLLAIREPDARSWTFIDAMAATPKALSTLFPETAAAEFETNLKSPPREPPVLESRQSRLSASDWAKLQLGDQSQDSEGARP